MPERPRLIGLIMASTLFVGSLLTLLDSLTSVPGWLYPLMMALLVTIAAFRIGSWFHHGLPEENFAFGCMILSLWPVVLHLVGGLRAPFLAIPVFAMAIRGPGEMTFVNLRHLPSKVWISVSRCGPFGIAMLLLGSAGLSWAFLSTLAPPAGMDALTYHIGLGVQYLARASLTPPDAVHYYQYTQAGEMLALMTLALDPSGIAANILFGLSLPFAVMTGARAAGELAGEVAGAHEDREEICGRTRMMVYGVTSTSAILLFTISHTKTEALTLLLFMLGIRRILPASFSPWRAAFFLGSSLAVKVTAVYGVLPAVLVLAWRTRRQKSVWFSCCVLLLLMPSYWWIRNILQFGTIMPQSGHVMASAAGSIAAPVVERLLRVFASYFLFIDQGIDGPYGAAFAVLTMSAILAWRFPAARAGGVSLRILSFLTSTSIALWFVTGGGSHAYARGGLFRFVLPALGACLIGGSVFLSFWISTLKKSTGRKLILTGFTLAVAVSFGVAVHIHMRYQPFPAYLCGGISMEDYMRNWSSSWKIQDEAARLLPADAKVLSIGESRLFHLGRNASFEFDADLPRIFAVIHETDTTDEEAAVAHIAHWMKKERYTHILHAPDWYAVKILVGLAPSPPRYGDRAVLEKYLLQHTNLALRDTAANVSLYEVK